MEVFEIFFWYVACNFLTIDSEVWLIQMCALWTMGIGFVGFIIILFWINLIIFVFEAMYGGICTLVGYDYLKFLVPIPSIKHSTSYLDSLLSSFSTEFVSRTEEFTPPFVFGYRKYFFARIIGWKGTWASFLKQYRRRIKSSVFEWGYKNRIPSWYYYTLRGGLRVQIVTPNHFRRVSSSSYNSPLWFYSFPVRPKKGGFRGDEWDRYFYSPFRGQNNYRRLYTLYRQVERPRTRYLYLSAWLEKCAPSMSSRYRRSLNYGSAIDSRSPYGYSNFSTYFNNISHVSHQRPTQLGMEQAVLYVDSTAHERLKPRLVRLFRKFLLDEKLPYLHTVTGKRHARSIGKYILIDKEALKMKIFLLKYINYTTGPSRKYDTTYDYPKFSLLYWYHTFVEFLSLVFDSFYIYPFEFDIVFEQILIKNEHSSISSFMAEIFEWFLYSESIFVFNNSLIYCLTLVFVYFMVVVFSLQFGRVFITRLWSSVYGLIMETVIYVSLY